MRIEPADEDAEDFGVDVVDSHGLTGGFEEEGGVVECGGEEGRVVAEVVLVDAEWSFADVDEDDFLGFAVESVSGVILFAEASW